MLFVWGYGPLKIEDIRIGETLLSDYADVEVETREGRVGDAPITLIPAQVVQDGVGVTLLQADGWTSRTSKKNSDELSVDISFPRGLVYYTNTGGRASLTVKVDVQYRAVGAADWINAGPEIDVLPGNITLPASTQTVCTEWAYPEEGGAYCATYSTSDTTTTWGVYISRLTGAKTVREGTGTVDNEVLIGSAVVTGANFDSVTDASPNGVTGCNVSQVGSASDRTISVAAGSVTGIPFLVTDAYVGTLRKGVRWKVARGQYEVRLQRVTADTDDSQTVDDVQWTYLRSIRNEHPVKFPKPLAMTAVRIRATEQLQGVINNLNGIVTSYAPDWNGSSWAEAATNNPASLVRLCHTGPFNARPRTLSQIGSDNLADFHEFCAANGYEFNMVRDFKSGVWDTVADICSAARAAPTIIDGRRGVIMDDANKPISQHFTPRNSWGFQFEIDFVDLPDALRVKFTNEENGYQDDERIVCNDGFTEETAVNFETAQFPGITDPDLIWKFGRYHLAQPKLRPSRYTFSADFENLVCQRGDLIRVGHDVPMWGGGWGRVKSLVLTGDEETGFRTAGVVLDEAVAMIAGTSYACRFRLEDNTSFVASIENDPGETREITFQTSIPVAQGPQVGDMAMFGEAERETVELLVKKIIPGEDLTAKIVCVDKAAEIYNADTGAIPAHDPKVTAGVDLTIQLPPTPVITSIQTGTSALVVNPSGGFRARILVNVQGAGGTPKTANIAVRARLRGSSQWRIISQPISQTVIAIDDVFDGEMYDIQAQAESIYGAFSDWTAVQTVTVAGLSEPPADITGFSCNIIDGNAYLSWNVAAEIDLAYTQIRWSPKVSGVTWAESIKLVPQVGTPATSITVPAMVGSYLAKAFDSSGNASINAAIISTSIAAVQGLNFVDTLEQNGASWTGGGDGVEYSADLGGIVLSAAGDLYDADDLYGIPDLYRYGGLRAEGRFYLGRIDLGGAFTSRLTASIEIGSTNYASDLYAADDLYALDNLYATAEGQYSATIEISTTTDDPEGIDPVWTDSAPALVGDSTAWAYDVWVRLAGTPPSITPVVLRSSIIIDMPDRVVGFSASIPGGGGSVTFDPAFYVTPKTGITVLNLQEGDAYTVSNESPSGFDIAFTNGGAPVARSLTGVARAYGSRTA